MTEVDEYTEGAVMDAISSAVDFHTDATAEDIVGLSTDYESLIVTMADGSEWVVSVKETN